MIKSEIQQQSTELVKVWGFFYNDCIYESASALISLHFSEDGAKKAMAWHKEEKREEQYKLYEDEPDDDEEMKKHNKKMREQESGIEAWFIQELKIQP